jgi:streptogramin lyase
VVAGLLALPTAAAAEPAVTGEFPLSETPRGIAAGPDGNIYVLLNGQAAGKQVARITPAGDVTEIASPALKDAGGLVAGPDGNMWATLGNGVAKFAPAHPADAEKFPIVAISDARGIAVGADGNLWVGSGENVVQVPPGDPAGFTFKKVDGMGARGVGRSGDLIWVADFASKRLVSVTTAAVVDPIPVGGGGPQGVAGGPGGQIAYGNPNANATELGRLVPGGTPLPTPIGATDPFGVVFGADQAYWFAQFNTSNLGRLTPDGKYTELGGLSAGSGPREIATGPGNTLWLSLETAKKVARVSGVTPPVADDPDPHPGPPVVSRLKLSRATFHKGSKTTIAFNLSEPAQVRLSLAAVKPGRKAGGKCRAPARANRRGKRCRRFGTLKPAITVNGKAGANAVRFGGRLSRRKSLRPGPYRLTLSATDAGGLRSALARASFRLLR